MLNSVVVYFPDRSDSDEVARERDSLHFASVAADSLSSFLSKNLPKPSLSKSHHA